MKRITDKQRIDFLQAQSFTKWVGYDTKGCTMSIRGGPLEPVKGSCSWPVFEHSDLRKEIDQAIKAPRER